MSTNPYQSPGSDFPSDMHARSRVSGPATGLMVTAIIFLALLVLGMVFNIFLLTSGLADEMQQPNGMSKNEQVAIRMMFGMVLMAVNGIILYGAVQMKGLQNIGMAKTACILAVIPCCGPCYIFGIPFGIWGLTVLNDPQVQQAFKS
jgi:hypothetical protein